MVCLGSAGAGLVVVHFKAHPVDPHRPRNILELLLAHVADIERNLPLICWYALPERQIAPGLASVSRRAAILTPSPKMSPSSMMMSPTLIPMRNSIRRSSGMAALRSAMARWISMAQRTASTALANSTKRTITCGLDDTAAMFGDLGIDKFAVDIALSAARVPSSSTPIRRL